MQNLYRLLRIARNMPVHTLAEKIGVTNSYINAIDKGTRTPSQRLEKSILTALDISPVQFAYMQQENAHIEQFEQALLMVLRVLCGEDDDAPHDCDVTESEPEPQKLHFRYRDKQYSFTDDEVLAAHQFQEHRLLLDKAKSNFRKFFILDGSTEPLCDDESENAVRYFEQQYSIRYEDASGLLEDFVQRYQEDYDPKIPEETQWVSAIHGVLIEHADL